MSTLFWLRALILKALPSGWSRASLLARECCFAGSTLFGETKAPGWGCSVEGRFQSAKRQLQAPGQQRRLLGLGRHCCLVACQTEFPARKRLLTGKTTVCCSGWQSLKPICTSPGQQKILCSFFFFFGGVLLEQEF